MDQVIWTNIS